MTLIELKKYLIKVLMHKKAIVVGVSLILFGFILFLDNGLHYNFNVLFLNYLIIIISIVQIFSSKTMPFSLHGITNLFFLFFIGLAPALQFKQGIHFMGVNGGLSPSNFLPGI